jgi:hypothetical protein
MHLYFASTGYEYWRVLCAALITRSRAPDRQQMASIIDREGAYLRWQHFASALTHPSIHADGHVIAGFPRSMHSAGPPRRRTADPGGPPPQMATIDREGAYLRWQHLASAPTGPSIRADGSVIAGLPGSAQAPGARGVVGVERGARTAPVRVGDKARGRSPRGSDASAPGAAERSLASQLEHDLVSWAWQEAHGAQPQDLAMLVWSLAAVQCKDQPLLTALIVRASAIVRHFTPAQMAMLWQGLAGLNVAPEPAAARELLGWVEEEAARFSLRHATQTLRAMRSCGVRKCAALTALKLRRAQARASYGKAADTRHTHGSRQAGRQ